MTYLKKFLNFLKHHIHHIIFVISILSLASLIAWWSVFIYNSIQQKQKHQFEKLLSDMNFLALKLKSDSLSLQEPGILVADSRFEIVKCAESAKKLSVSLEPFDSGLCLQPRSHVLQQIKEKSGRLNFMLVGESSLMFLIVIISIFFLYRFIRLERRSTHEIREFWERTAHEIKTPITGLKAFLQNLKSHSKELGEMTPYVDIALKQVGRQEKLAENILFGYRLRSARTSLKISKINLNAFITEYFQEALHLARAAVNINFDQKHSSAVRGEPNALKTILDNITDNAIKYCSPEVALTVDMSKTRKNVVLTIADNGPGFKPTQAENLFQAYKHLDRELPPGQHGAGIGLFISRQLARAMGGDLWAESEGKSKGARFRLRLSLS